jgi:hypothetical protein
MDTLENRINKIAKRISESRMTQNQIRTLLIELLKDVVKKYGLLPLVRLMLPVTEKQVEDRTKEICYKTDGTIENETVKGAYEEGVWIGLTDAASEFEGN